MEEANETVERIQTTAETSNFSKTFVLTGEDHTLGNSIRYCVMRDPDVQFCGYTIPHPMEDKMHVRVQTNGKKRAEEALKDGFKTLSQTCDILSAAFDAALDSRMSDM